MKKSILFSITLCSFLYSMDKIKLDKVDVIYNEKNSTQNTVSKMGGGSSIINKNVINQLATQNGDITSFLKINPNVRFNNSHTSNNLADISAQDISINGAHHYQNKFMIDNYGMNNDLNPQVLKKFNDNHTNPFGLLDSKTQGINLDIDLVESLEIHDSFIPAKYGGFTGGVVKAKTKTPTKDFSGKFSVSHTRDGWTKIKRDSYEKRVGDHGSIIPHHDDFLKTAYRLNLEGYLSDNFGLIFGYTKNSSKFKQNEFDSLFINKEFSKTMDKKLKKSIDNFFVKGIWHINDTFTLTPVINYTISNEDNYLANSFDSYSKQKSKDYNIGFELKGEFDNFAITQNFGYQNLHTKRDSDTNYFIAWWFDKNRKNWGELFNSKKPDDLGNLNTKSYEGGYGDVEQSQQNFSYSFDSLSNEFALKDTTHKINFGLEYEYKIGKFSSNERSYQIGATKYEKNGRIFDAVKSEYKKKAEELKKHAEHLKKEASKEKDPETMLKNQKLAQWFEDKADELEGNADILELLNQEYSFESMGDSGVKKEFEKCQKNDPFCYADGTGVVQFAGVADIYGPGSVRVKVHKIGSYLDDEIRYKRLLIRPGLRYDFDNYTKKHTLAPRFLASFDVFDDENLVFSLGANRYYGRSSFAFALDDAITQNLMYKGSRDNPQTPWKLSKYPQENLYKNLKIPYDDEIGFSVNYKFNNFDLMLKYINRKGKDQVKLHNIKEKDKRSGVEKTKYRYYANDGFSKSDIYTISFKNQNSFKILNTYNDFEIGFDYSKTERNNEFAKEQDYYELISYNGKILRKRPSENFNTPYTLRLRTTTKFPKWNLSFSNFFSYVGPYKMNVLTTKYCYLKNGSCSDDEDSGLSIPVIETKKYSGFLNWDLRLSYAKNLYKNSSLFVNLDVLNILNKKSVIGFNDGGHKNTTGGGENYKDELVYNRGRQFYLELGFKF
ncbi:TonB-dependent receptor [Campylobacter portucalensis]|nr:hypothetical protein [Campylobacter portucalensis]